MFPKFWFFESSWVILAPAAWHHREAFHAGTCCWSVMTNGALLFSLPSAPTPSLPSPSLPLSFLLLLCVTLTCDPQPRNSKLHLSLFSPVISCRHFYLTNGFKLWSKDCTVKAGIHRNLLLLGQPDLWVHNLMYKYKQHQTNPQLDDQADVSIIFSLIYLQSHLYSRAHL